MRDRVIKLNIKRNCFLHKKDTSFKAKEPPHPLLLHALYGLLSTTKEVLQKFVNKII